MYCLPKVKLVNNMSNAESSKRQLDCQEQEGIDGSEGEINANACSTWSVYIVMRNDNKLYTGITNNMAARWKKHSNNQGAKFFRGRHPIALCYQEPDHSRSSASQREYQIKKLSRQQKQQLILATYGPFQPTS
jgi:putative endonuclease